MRLVYALVCVPAVALACGSGSGGPDLPTSGGTSGSSSGNSGAVQDDGGIPFPPTGNQYVDARRCPACHQGPDPQTTGVMSGAIDPIPGDFGTGVVLYGPNLTPDMTTGIGSWTDDQIQTAILYGIDNQGEHLCPEMSHFPDMGTDEVQSIIAFLHTLPAVSHQTMGSVCPPLKQ